MSDATGSPDVTFRSFRAEDAPAVKDLNVAALRSIYPLYKNGPWNVDLDAIEDRYLDGGDFLVGLEGSQIVAIGALRRVSAEVAEIKRVGVDPERQGRGIGTALLLALERRASDLGFSRIILDTTEKQLVAQGMYERHGYVEIDRKPVAYSPRVTMETSFYEKILC